MRIRRSIATLVAAGALSLGTVGAASATPTTYTFPPASSYVPAGVDKAVFCQRAGMFFTWFDSAINVAMTNLQAAVTAAQSSGNAVLAATLQNRLTRATAWVDGIHQFEQHINAFCTAPPAV
jgi:hypothetical protein